MRRWGYRGVRRRAMRDCRQFRRSELASDAFHSFTDALFGLLYQKSGGRGRNAPTRGVCRALRVITRSRRFWIHDSHGRAGKVLARSLGGVWGIFAKIRGRVVRVRVQATLGLWPVHVVRVRVQATLGPRPIHVMRVRVHVMRDDRVWLTNVRGFALAIRVCT